MVTIDLRFVPVTMVTTIKEMGTIKYLPTATAMVRRFLMVPMVTTIKDRPTITTMAVPRDLPVTVDNGFERKYELENVVGSQ